MSSFKKFREYLTLLNNIVYSLNFYCFLNVFMSAIAIPNDS